jgi:uncharacterized protein YciI
LPQTHNAALTAVTLEEMVTRFLLQYQPPRDGFAESLTREESTLIAAHFDYLGGLYEAGIVTLAGRVEDGRFGLALLTCENLAAAKKLAAADPAVKGRLFRIEVFPFRLALPPDGAD